MDLPADMDDRLARPAPARDVGQRLSEWVAWFGMGRLVIVAVSIALVGAGGYWLVSPPPPPVEASLPMASTVPPTSVTPPFVGSTTTVNPEPIDIVVHVAGAVVAPGIHRVSRGARVADAVMAAGGLTSDAHPDAINLAAPLSDGDRVYVPRLADGVTVPVGISGVGSGVSADAGAPSGPVSINEASEEELDTLPGVGPATAAAIVAHREQFGPFSSIDGLAEVRGIGPAKLEAIRPLVSL